MTNQRQISINIVIETLARHRVLNVEHFMTENKDELIKTMKEVEKTERWSQLKEKVEELLRAY